MSMFDMVIGNSGLPKPLMDVVWDVEPDMVGRYRDHWLERDENGDEPALVLAVYARIGGGNREEYAEGIAKMQALTTYVSDADDAYDSTYATFRFRLAKSDFQARMLLKEEEGAVHRSEASTMEDVWRELWDVAEPVPRDMSLVWQAMIATLSAHAPEGEK